MTMKFITDHEMIETCISQFIDLVENNRNYIDNGYTVDEIPDGRGKNGNGALRHHIFLGFTENDNKHNLLEINIPYEYDGNVGALRGRIATDANGRYILRSTIGMTTAGRINIREQVEDGLRDRIVNIEDKPWIIICNINRFDIDDVIVALVIIKSCRDGVFFRNIPGEFSNSIDIIEGAKHTVIVNRYERDAGARKQCIEHWGEICHVCTFSFEKQYGDYGAGYIHVHHLKPLSEIGEEYHLNPIKDMRPVCPNCHAMLHRSTPALTIDALKKIAVNK